MTDHITVEDAARMSVTAIVTYALLGLVTLIAMGVFAIIFTGSKVEPVMLGVLGSLITAVTSLATAAVGYWVGASVGGKAANAALAQIAGAGPPPPATPLADDQRST